MVERAEEEVDELDNFLCAAQPHSPGRRREGQMAATA